MSGPERARLARALAEIDSPVLADPRARRRRRIVLAAILSCAIALAGWICVLAITLPRYYRAGGWRAAWVGFDVALLLVLAATAWAVWRRRQLLIICLVVLATLLCCDAWFDVLLDWRTAGFMLSVLTAAFAELPLAVLAMIGARRLLRLTAGRLEALQGGPVTPFWRVPLFGAGAAGYQDLLHRGGGPPDPGSAGAPAGRGRAQEQDRAG